MNNIFSNIRKVVVAVAALPLLGGMITSCSDDPDESNYYTFKGQMMSQYLQSDENFSDFATIVQRAGFMDQLSAYGHYTCFLPNNKAVQTYLAKKGISSLDALSDAECDTIARTHLMNEIYSVSDMTGDGSSVAMLPTQNMLHRNVQVEHITDADSNSVVRINGNSVINFVTQDDSVENGIVQQVDVVLENSTSSIASILLKDPKISFFANAVHETGLDQRLDSIEDKAYAQRYENGDYDKYDEQMLTTGSRSAEIVYCPKKKLYGFTVFAVPDEVLQQQYGVNDMKGLYDLACSIYDPMYPDDVNKEGHDYSHLNDSVNPLHRFIAYHILNRNVQGYNYLTVRDDAGVDVDKVDPTEWYYTLLPYTMMKVEKLTVSKWADRSAGIAGDRYINRRFNDTYSYKGIHVQSATDVDNNAINGIYFYVDDILKFDDETQNNIQNDRIRMDFSTIFPEIQTNNQRMTGPATNKSSNETGYNYNYPPGYLDGVVYNAVDSRLTYWYPRPGYYSMNGDEMDAQEVFDITFNLPPIPFTGEWQIRLGFAPMSKSDGAERGQVQIYIDGKAQGIPLNMAEPIDLASVYGGSFPSYTNIVNDDDARQEDFKILKNKGYYRGPYSVFNSSTGTIAGKYSYFAEMSHTVRKVLATTHLEAGVNHTIRIKNVSTVLPKKKEAMLDYLELVPKSVYGVSGTGTSEDDL